MATIPDMTPEERQEVAELIAGWMMEFGAGWVSCKVTRESEWYSATWITVEEDLPWAFDWDQDDGTPENRYGRVKISKTGMNFFKNYER